MGDVLIRPARANDASSLAALSIEVWLGTYQRSGVSRVFADYVLATYTPAHMDTVLAGGEDKIFVAEQRDGIVGYVRVGFDNPCPTKPGVRTEIVTLYVQPRHHGAGIGRALTRCACEEIAAQGLRNLWVATNSENTPAIGFYQRIGFEAAGQTWFELHEQRFANDIFLAEDLQALTMN